MSSMQGWIVHRAKIINLTWPQGVADAAGIATTTVESIVTTGSLSQIGRGALGYIARALKVSVRDLEALETGEINWIADERRIDFDRAAGIAHRLSNEIPQAVLCSAQLGIPILGRILETQFVEQFENWTSDDGRRIPVRYAGLPDAFCLELTVVVASVFAADYLVFHPIPPGEMRDGEWVLLTTDASEQAGELRRIHRRVNAHYCAFRDAPGKRKTRRIEFSEILRAARVLGTWKE